MRLIAPLLIALLAAAAPFAAASAEAAPARSRDGQPQSAPAPSAPAQNAPAQNAPAPAAAPNGAPQNQSLPSDGGSGWRVECANDGKALDCRAIDRVSHRETQQLIAGVAIRIPPDTRKPIMTILLPLGVQVTEPVTLQVDKGSTERYPVQTCTQAGCLAGAPASDAVIGALRSGQGLKVAFQSATGQTITVTMPLAGFALAFDKIK
jgi:invasion protein IalB